VAEEIGLQGAAALDIAPLNLDFGYVLDTSPPVGTFVTRTGTHDSLDVTIIGKPAHAGKEPEKGINAIQVLADAVSNMKLGRIGPETTANLGTIQGGSAVNVVCSKVKIRGEVRSTSVEELEKQVDHMVGEFERAARAWGATVEIDHGRHYVGYTIADDSRVVRVGQAASRAVGLDPVLRLTLGGSDANIFNAKGVPTVVMACGMDQVHTHDERVTRKDLVNTARLAYATLIEAAK
jgi:tripeptide aminopeptidase